MTIKGYYIGRDIPAEDPRVKAGRFLMGPNIWPPFSLVPEAMFKQPLTTYYAEMQTLSLKVLEIIAHGMPYGNDVFNEFVSNDPIAALRLLHYPPQASSDAKQFGSGAHTDFGAITLLLQDQNHGLQVQNPDNREWVPIPPNAEAYVVNLGDMLSRWTGGRYKSNLHRVLNKGGKDRYSVPFFFDGNLDAKLRPFDGGEVDGEVLTVEDHMRERFATTYGRVKSDA